MCYRLLQNGVWHYLHLGNKDTVFFSAPHKLQTKAFVFKTNAFNLWAFHFHNLINPSYRLFRGALQPLDFSLKGGEGSFTKLIPSDSGAQHGVKGTRRSLEIDFYPVPLLYGSVTFNRNHLIVLNGKATRRSRPLL